MIAGPYTHISLRNVRTGKDGTLIFISGRLRRTLTCNELYDRDSTLDLLGEPFSWLPLHGTALDVWGQLWLGSTPRLLVHDARPLGNGHPVPDPVRLPEAGALIRLTARVTWLGSHATAVTSQRHTYLLNGLVPAPGVYQLSGLLLSLTPPVFQVQTCSPAPDPLPIHPGGTLCEPH